MTGVNKVPEPIFLIKPFLKNPFRPRVKTFQKSAIPSPLKIFIPFLAQAHGGVKIMICKRKGFNSISIKSLDDLVVQIGADNGAFLESF